MSRVNHRLTSNVPNNVNLVSYVLLRRCYSRKFDHPHSFQPPTPLASAFLPPFPLSAFQTVAIFRGCSRYSQTLTEKISCASAASLRTSMLLSTLRQLEQAARARAGPRQRLSGLQSRHGARPGRDASATSSGLPGGQQVGHDAQSVIRFTHR